MPASSRLSAVENDSKPAYPNNPALTVPVSVISGCKAIMRAMSDRVIVVGGGLAGVEAAAQIAKRGVRVVLFEMRPKVMTPAHRTDRLAELVCSSSLKSNSPTTAHGLLKEEMRRLGSIVLDCAARSAVPGGDALCVDRDKFAELVTSEIEREPLIDVVREEVIQIPAERPCVIATGPLTSPALCESIAELTGAHNLHFFDAIAPSVEAESIDMSKVFRQSRYDKGEAAYLNCPMSREQYEAFIDALLTAEVAHLHLEEERDPRFFEGCLPVEVVARRGRNALAYGTMKPVGLRDPRTGKRPYAVVQLRQENAEASVYGLVGFQTQLRPSEQERVFRMIPGLQNARFVRYGQVHRNTYIDSPNVLTPALHTLVDKGLYFAGQLVGVEGYVESAATGILAGINAARVALGEEPVVAPTQTMIGALADYVANCPVSHFQPMNSNFGILPPLEGCHPKKISKQLNIDRARTHMDAFVRTLSECERTNSSSTGAGDSSHRLET
ncbi:MAG: methylenetetrahydrofolate--tRNA-(uracil(54)-C(5))-methyltransferase (FADH(2)-oxidizing) TrmFO [Armatimonadota bacterium]